MTYREKHRERFPTANADLVHIFQCPRNPNTGEVVACTESGCRACWDREMDEVTEDGKGTLPR